MNAQSEVRQRISGGRSLANLCGGINLANALVAAKSRQCFNGGRFVYCQAVTALKRYRDPMPIRAALP